MELFVNGQSIEFELENDNNSFDIIRSIADFCITLKPQQFLSKILINGNEYLFEDEDNLKNILINDIKKIEIETTNVIGHTLLLMNNFEEIIKYISNIINGSNWNDEYKKIYKSLELLKDGIEKIGSLFKNQDKFSFDSEIFNEAYEPLYKTLLNISKDNYPLGRDAVDNSNSDIDKILKTIKEVKGWLQSVELTDDTNEICNKSSLLVGEIDAIVPKLSNVPLLFQTGSDKEAMQTIQELTSILEKSIKIFVSCKGSDNEGILQEMDFENFFSTLTLNLKELMNSIENKDSVMIGDLLEYEFIPKVENIKSMLMKIK